MGLGACQAGGKFSKSQCHRRLLHAEIIIYVDDRNKIRQRSSFYHNPPIHWLLLPHLLLINNPAAKGLITANDVVSSGKSRRPLSLLQIRLLPSILFNCKSYRFCNNGFCLLVVSTLSFLAIYHHVYIAVRPSPSLCLIRLKR